MPLNTVVVTDSTADLPKSLIETLGIAVIPLRLKIEEQTYTDGIDLAVHRFYDTLDSLKESPTTEPPSVNSFITLYGELLQRYDRIVSFHISSRLSKTFEHARQAATQGYDYFRSQRDQAKRLNPYKIRVLDSRLASAGLGLAVLKLHDRIWRNEAAFDEIAFESESLYKKMNFLFTLDDLKYMKRSERVNTVNYLFAKLANIKPILTLSNGVIEPIDKVRGYEQAVESIITNFEVDYKQFQSGSAMLVYAGDERAAAASVGYQHLKSALRKTNCKLIESSVGATIGAHIGPGAMGLAYYLSE
jgi:DegV family protein with EDD domain